MITKEQFLKGVPFHYFPTAKTKPYKFKPWENREKGDPMGMLFYFIVNEANVTRVTSAYFDCYTTVLSKVLKARIYFKDLYTDEI